MPDAAWLRRIRRRLLAWFRRHARDLPWRHTRDPYAVWVSEIMLQQTQVASVIGYYARFLQAFPNIADLAAADEQQVLRQWEGLGYYRRARQMHQAARVIVERHGGQFPRDPETIRGLPGIGRYTAGAIASIAWDASEPILEANTIRLYSRLLAYRDDPARSEGQRTLWTFAAQLLPRQDCGAFNQALMELGSEICTPRNPQCPHCPVQQLCPTHAAGLQDEIPLPSKRTVYEELLEAALVVRRNDCVLLRCCGPGERWAGMWDFPRFPIRRPRGKAFVAEAVRQTAELTGQRVALGEHLTTIKHGVTRYRITLVCHEARWIDGPPDRDDLRWVEPSHLDQIPLNVTSRKISRILS
ncbi:MAG: A/G-specific adenine glycosylase [Pirellulaceae bacterium]|nr:A/G-specific adenine glycosylase [Pirellulaceae bacterium]